MKNTIVERPIMFSGPMVRAILEGRKTQTRRMIKPQPNSWIDDLHGNEFRKRAPYAIEDDNGNYCGWGFQDEDNHYKCPYGKNGERLWVRETCWSDGQEVYYSADEAKGQWLPHRKRVKKGRDLSISRDESYQRLLTLHHYAGGFCRKVPAIHMPRWACRIVLEIENIRVERLHEITNADCLAEGIQPLGPERVTERTSSGVEELPVQIHIQAGKFDNRYSTVRGLFAGIWQQIHGVESWIADPWVWVIQFRKIEDR
jgi:hypothetical protein